VLSLHGAQDFFEMRKSCHGVFRLLPLPKVREWRGKPHLVPEALHHESNCNMLGTFTALQSIPILKGHSRGHTKHWPAAWRTTIKSAIVAFLLLLSCSETERSIQPGYILLDVTRDRG
jgi:hypothetical protein